MKQRGGIKLVLCLIGLGLFILAPNKLVALDDHLIINEVQINGAGGTQEDFIELYNPTGASINLKGYRLVKRTKTGTSDTSIKSWTGDESIAAGGYYLWANSNNNFATTINSDASTSQTIAADNGIALRFGKEDEGEIIDSVGWGTCANVFVEGTVFSSNLESGKSIKRQNFVDTNNNADDFAINDLPDPQSSKTSASQNNEASCGNGKLEDGEDCDDGNGTNGDGCDSGCAIEKTDGATTTATATTTTVQTNTQANFHWGDVVINELVSDPSDEDVEWVELFNTSYKEIDLNNWTIEDGSGAKTKLSGKIGTSGKNKFFVVNKPAGSLNNAGDLVVLKYFDGIIDKVTYGNWDDSSKDDNAPVAHDPNALARQTDGHNTGNNKNDFVITAKPTKGESNIILKTNDEQNNSSSENCNIVKDIVITEIFPNPIGTADNQDEFIEIYNQSGSNINLSGWSLGDGSKKKYEFKQAIIPAGSFLAVKRSESGLSLNNDEDAVSIYQPDCDLASETVKYSSAKEGWSYNDAMYSQNNASSTKHKWAWSDKATPGQLNEMLIANEPPEVAFDAPADIEVGQPIIFDSSDTIDESTSSLKYFWEFGDGATSSLAVPEHTYFKVGSYKIKLTVSDGKNETSKTKTIKVVKKGGVIVKGASSAEAKKTTKKATTKKTATTKKPAVKTTVVSLDKINNLAKGDKVKVEGSVAVLPGIFGTQYFYIVGSGGVQVYNYKKEFPELKIGDVVAVTGEITSVSGEQRIKTAIKNDIKIIKNESAPEPEVFSCENINEESAGRLVSVSGEVTEKKGYAVFLDDGTDEAQIYLKKNTGLSSGDFTEGEKIEVRGIVGKSGTDLRIMPRGKEDIIKQNDEAGKVLGEVSQNDNWELPQKDRTMELLKYLLAISIFIIAVLVVVVAKNRKK